MKKQIILIALAMVAVAAQAGSEKSSSDKESSCCCSDATAGKSAKAHAGSRSAKAQHTGNQAAAKTSSDKQTLQSPKAFADAR